MDLIVNGPVKSGIRRVRCEDLFDYMQNWKIKRLQALHNKTPLPKFSPPKPKVADGLRILLSVCNETFTSDSFKERSITLPSSCPLTPDMRPSWHRSQW
jgi:hypothetical protein